MPPINATVNWDDTLGKGTVADIQVPAANGSTVITWSCGTNVSSFAISGLDSNEFTPADSNGQGNSFTTTDRNDTAQEYSYTVTATHTSGKVSSHDPKIENGT